MFTLILLATVAALIVGAYGVGFAVDLDWDGRDRHLDGNDDFTTYTVPQLRRAQLRHQLLIKRGDWSALQSLAYLYAINAELSRRGR